MIVARARITGGFTLLELLIVIAIIGSLSSFVLVSTASSRVASRNVHVLEQLREIEKAFILYAADHLTTWPDIFAGPSNTVNRIEQFNLDVLVRGTPITWEGPKQFPGFDAYLRSVPAEPLPGGYYGYSNFNVPLTSGCSGYGPEGVGIRIAGGSDTDRTSLFTYLDEQIDGSDGALCGRVRTVGNEVVLYVFATDPNDIL